MKLYLTFTGRDSFGRALFRDQQKCRLVDIEDVSSTLDRPQYDLRHHHLHTVTDEWEPDIPVMEWKANTVGSPYQPAPVEFCYVLKDGRLVKPFVSWNWNTGYSPNRFTVTCAGGYPHIASPLFEVYHPGGGWDLASLAFIKPDGIWWLDDADLLDDADRKKVEQIVEDCNAGRKMILV